MCVHIPAHWVERSCFCSTPASPLYLGLFLYFIFWSIRLSYEGIIVESAQYYFKHCSMMYDVIRQGYTASWFFRFFPIIQSLTYIFVFMYIQSLNEKHCFYEDHMVFTNFPKNSLGDVIMSLSFWAHSMPSSLRTGLSVGGWLVCLRKVCKFSSTRSYKFLSRPLAI